MLQSNKTNQRAASFPVERSNDQTLFIVANRLPVEYHPVAGWRPSPGGLVSALEAATRDRKTVWIGWRGSPVSEETLRLRSTRPQSNANVDLIEVPISHHEAAYFYNGVCNGALWPLYHNSAVTPTICDCEFKTYQLVNQRFAERVAKSVPLGAKVWIHDYQLQLVPQYLRKMRADLKIGFFLHIPFPDADTFETFPWHQELIRGLLGADLIGFQTQKSVDHFIHAARRHADVSSVGNILSINDGLGSHRPRVDAFPVGTDAERFSDLAQQPASRGAAEDIREDFNHPQLLVLGIDRLDYTKAIDLRIEAVASLLQSEAYCKRDIQFIQVAMPSRMELAAYQQTRMTVEQALYEANTKLTALGLRPIYYIHDALPIEQVVALYVASDVMIVTSHADGMNLVCKEYVAARNDCTGRLVLSKTAGAAAQLTDAWLVDPTDTKDIKRGIKKAIDADLDEARRRMQQMRDIVFNSDAKHWADAFLSQLSKQ